jgi:hypothetical protein
MWGRCVSDEQSTSGLYTLSAVHGPSKPLASLHDSTHTSAVSYHVLCWAL